MHGRYLPSVRRQAPMNAPHRNATQSCGRPSRRNAAFATSSSSDPSTSSKSSASVQGLRKTSDSKMSPPPVSTQKFRSSPGSEQMRVGFHASIAPRSIGPRRRNSLGRQSASFSSRLASVISGITRGTCRTRTSHAESEPLRWAYVALSSSRGSASGSCSGSKPSSPSSSSGRSNEIARFLMELSTSR